MRRIIRNSFVSAKILRRQFKCTPWIAESAQYLKDVDNEPLEQSIPSPSHLEKGSIELNSTICSGCGTPFQSSYPNSPGYLTKEKYKEHAVKTDIRNRVKEGLKIVNTAGIDVQSELAVQILKDAGVPDIAISNLQGVNRKVPDVLVVPDADPSKIDVPELLSIKEEYKAFQDQNSVNICQRCYRLKQYGQLETKLRPGWSDDAALSAEKFQQVISIAKDVKCVVLCLIDVFDLSGSVLTNLKEIAGKNPIMIGANKVDLLPKNVPPDRLTTWIYNELRDQCKLMSMKEKQEEIEDFKKKNMSQKGWYEANVIQQQLHEGVLKKESIHLISCSTGKGVKELIQSAILAAKDFGSTVYVLGAANVGKSSFINHLIDTSVEKQKVMNRTHGSRNSQLTKYKSLTASPQTTVSNVPGTTLNCIKISLPNQNVIFMDTPGIINSTQLTTKITTDELPHVIPQKTINCITHRLTEKKVVLIGGYARIELTEGKPFFFSFFMSNNVTLHPTDSIKADEIISKHIGGMITPPFTAERLEEIGPLVDHYFEISGDSWKKGTADIVIAGLGWICITGPGLAKITVKVPKGIAVSIREPLLPFEAWQSTASFSGGRWIQKQGKSTRKYK